MSLTDRFPVAIPYRLPLPGSATLPLSTGTRIFYQADQPWRWKGVSAFKLLDRFARGENIIPFLDAYRGFNLLRVFLYVPVADWGDAAWGTPDPSTILSFLGFCQDVGFYVELTLLTDDDPQRIGQAQDLVHLLTQVRPPNLLLEIGNEPSTHKSINTRALEAPCWASGFPFSSGNYEDSSQFFGTYLTAHTGRDPEWPRRAHDLLEYRDGGGPNTLADPAHHVPCVADEPIRPDQAGYSVLDYLGYFASASLLGAGATFHSETGKLALPPTPDESRCAAAALQGLNAFPADAPLGNYSRPVEASLRTYVVGNFMARVRPTTPEAFEPGWRSLDPLGVCWSRE